MSRTTTTMRAISCMTFVRTFYIILSIWAMMALATQSSSRADSTVKHSFMKATRPSQITLYNVRAKCFDGRRFNNPHERIMEYVQHFRSRLNEQDVPHESLSTTTTTGTTFDVANSVIISDHALTRDNVNLPPASRSTKATRQTTSRLIALTGPVDNSMDDNEFLIRLAVGTPIQTFWALPDTGSPQTWVFGPDCCFAQNHSFFDYRASQTFSYLYRNGTEATANVTGYLAPDGLSLTTFTYGTSNANTTTFAALDYLDLPTFEVLKEELSDEGKRGFAHVKDVVVPYEKRTRLQFGIVTASDDRSRMYRKMEALLGLAPGLGSSLDNVPQITPIEKVFQMSNGALRKNMITFTMVKRASQSNSGTSYGGRITLGDVDDEAIVGQIAWVDSQSKNFWGTVLRPGAMQIDGHDLYRNTTALSARVIFDTGSALIFMPTLIAKAANSLLKGALFLEQHRRWVIPCTYGRTRQGSWPSDRNASTYSRFTITLANQTFGLPAEDLVLFPEQAVAYDDETNERYCLTAFQEGTDAFTVLGQTFIKNHVVIFDYGNDTTTFKGKRVGIANRKDVETF